MDFAVGKKDLDSLGGAKYISAKVILSVPVDLD